MSSPDPELPEEPEVLLARRILRGEPLDLRALKDSVDPEVLRGLERLQQLLAGAEGGATEEGPAREAPVLPPTPTPSPRSRDERFIGDFRLVRKLGEGGMGVVYEAEQQHPKRPVALKVIRGGANVSKDTLKLFRREIQTLARLNHSGIAQLYEAGATDDGMHFFAMELVRGVPLSDWLRSRPEGSVTPAELKLRLGIFRKICDAVAYAHQKGVVHRDLKPGNVLIPKPTAGSSMQDAVPDVKILDFGLARITDSDVQATTFITEMGRVQGTLPYMSPEQVRGNPDEIDLRTDVYSLGVMLYEMVTGQLPYDISKAQLHEAVRIICDEPPKSLASTFAGRRRLDADVITIATKCLEKEPTRRYQSATALSEDIQRWLTDQPILARRPSAAYQFRKLVLRHKLPFAFAGAVFVLLAVFAGAMAVQAARIARERDRANQAAKRATEEAAAAKAVSDFLEEMFTLADPSASRGGAITAKEILDAGAARVRDTLGNQPLIQARLMGTMGEVYQRLGFSKEAAQLLRQSVEINRRELGDSSPEYARSLNRLGWNLNIIGGSIGGGGRDAEALALHQEALRIFEKAYGPDHVDVAWSLYYVGQASRALKIFEKDPEQNWKGIAWCLQGLAGDAGGEGVDRKGLGDKVGAAEALSRAIALQQRVVAISERHLPPDHYDLGPSIGNLGFWLSHAGRFDEALPLFRRCVTICEKAGVPPQQPGYLMSMDNVAWALTGLGRYAEARQILERALQTAEEAMRGPNAPWVRGQVENIVEDLAELEEASSNYGKADLLYRRVIGLREDPPNEGGLAFSLEHYASLLAKMGRSEDAARAAARAKALRSKFRSAAAAKPTEEKKE